MPPTNLFGLGYGVGPAGYGYPSAGTVAAPPTLSYASPQSWTYGVAISTLSPTTTGATSFAVQSGALPTGVSLNTSTGAITGTPTVLAQGSTATIRATGPGGTADFVLTYAVTTAEGAAFFARLGTQPSNTDKLRYDRSVLALVDAGVWAKLDALYFLAAPIEATALVNLISSSYPCTNVSTPTFTPYVGFTGASGKYLDTGFNPSTASSPKFVAADAHVSVWALNAGQDDGNTFGHSGSAQVEIRPRDTVDLSYARVNCNNPATAVSKNGRGFHTVTRSVAVNQKFFKNGNEYTLEDVGLAGNAVHNSTLRILSGSHGEAVGQVAAACFGSRLTDAEVLALYRAIRSFVTRGFTIVSHGDSITKASNLTQPNIRQFAYTQRVAWAAFDNQGAICQHIVNGYDGASWSYDYGNGNLINTAAADVDVHLTDDARLVAFAGTNGIHGGLGGHTAAQEYADFETYIQARIAAGWNPDHIVVVTCLPRESGLSERAAYNALLAGGVATYGYRIARVDQDTTIGEDGDQNNATYYPDTIHPSEAGHTIIASIVYAAMFA